MKTPFALVAAVSVPLVLGAVGASAGELAFRSPSTDLQLTLDGDRIVESRDLTRTADDSALSSLQSKGGRDWSASIGNGHTTSNTTAAPSAAGSPSSAHWSASIGTGQVSGEPAVRPQAVATHLAGLTHVATSQAPSAHWTSKIGTAHAADSNKGAQNGKFTS